MTNSIKLCGKENLLWHPLPDSLSELDSNPVEWSTDSLELIIFTASRKQFLRQVTFIEARTWRWSSGLQPIADSRHVTKRGLCAKAGGGTVWGRIAESLCVLHGWCSQQVKSPLMVGRNGLNTYAPIPIHVLGMDNTLNVVLSSTNTYVELFCSWYFDSWN